MHRKAVLPRVTYPLEPSRLFPLKKVASVGYSSVVECLPRVQEDLTIPAQHKPCMLVHSGNLSAGHTRRQGSQDVKVIPGAEQVQRSTQARSPTDSEIVWSRNRAGDPKFEASWPTFEKSLSLNKKLK